jgi:hypothetical protein
MSEDNKIRMHIKDVCKIGQGHDCCRYLTMGPGGWDCEKHSMLKLVLDHRVITETIVARGDNCEGKTGEFLNGKDDDEILQR